MKNLKKIITLTLIAAILSLIIAVFAMMGDAREYEIRNLQTESTLEDIDTTFYSQEIFHAKFDQFLSSQNWKSEKFSDEQISTTVFPEIRNLMKQYNSNNITFSEYTVELQIFFQDKHEESELKLGNLTSTYKKMIKNPPFYLRILPLLYFLELVLLLYIFILEIKSADKC